jgi:hypothetical protein
MSYFESKAGDVCSQDDTKEAPWTVAKVIIGASYIVAGLVMAKNVQRCLDECLDKHVLALSIAVCFVGLTIPVSIYHSVSHLRNFYRPQLQSQVIRIVWMVREPCWNSLYSLLFGIFSNIGSDIFAGKLVLYNLDQICILFSVFPRSI